MGCNRPARWDEEGGITRFRLARATTDGYSFRAQNDFSRKSALVMSAVKFRLPRKEHVMLPAFLHRLPVIMALFWIVQVAAVAATADQPKPAATAATSDESAAKLLAAAKLLLKEDVTEGYVALRWVEAKYPDTASAQAATAEADLIWGDFAKRQEINMGLAKEECKKLIRSARLYIGQELYADARHHLDKLIKDHPLVPEVAIAQGMLESIKGK
jgi:hypothetical protein